MSGSYDYSTEQKLLATVPKIPALCSILGSSYIACNVLSNKDKRSCVYGRLMLGISLCDIFVSQGFLLGTLLIPRGSTGPFGDVYWALGNHTTCRYAGFVGQWNVASPIYNVMLSLYYLLKIRYAWTDPALCKIEPWLHFMPLAFAAATSVTALVMEWYGNVFWTCWINPNPRPEPDFIPHVQWAFLFGPVWMCILLQAIAMVLLWWTMLAQEQLMESYRFRPSSCAMESGSTGGTKMNSTHHKQSRMIAIQGILYVLGFYFTWLFPTITRITELFADKAYFPIQILDSTFLPFQGVFNFLIYFR